LLFPLDDQVEVCLLRNQVSRTDYVHDNRISSLIPTKNSKALCCRQAHLKAFLREGGLATRLSTLSVNGCEKLLSCHLLLHANEVDIYYRSQKAIDFTFSDSDRDQLSGSTFRIISQHSGPLGPGIGRLKVIRREDRHRSPTLAKGSIHLKYEVRARFKVPRLEHD
jgi:hypothetical protein